MRSLAIVVAVIASACSGNTPVAVDGTVMCTKAVYDPCNTEHDCAMMICQEFMTAGFQVCSQGCSATVPCPNDSTGSPGTCNAMNLCQPAAANSCQL